MKRRLGLPDDELDQCDGERSLVVKVLFDYRAFADLPYGGVTRYFVELAQHLSEAGLAEVTMFAPLHVNEDFQNGTRAHAIGIRVPSFRGVNRLVRPVDEVLTRLWTHAQRYDVLHETYYPRWKGGRARTPVVTTVHDMIHEKFIDPSSVVDGHKVRAVRAADRIICVSKHTRRDLLEMFGVDPGKVDVVYHGSSFARTAVPEEPVVPAGRPYLLYVGRRVPYKNFDRLLESFASSKRLQKDFDLLCFGGGAFTADEEERIAALRLPRSCVFHKGGADRHLQRIYGGATALVYPSLYEGFGLPPLEAMTMGCPVICSQSSSLPEVVGSAGAYFNPESVDSMREAIESTVYDPGRLSNMRNAGLLQAQRFSWEQCARD
ncbi:MAG: glycosyltransferase family 4 protein, partial [Bryobacteraceae bacterium]|nr:glycosyltransferase family 4 protein [Bryobacteraceae bacterium]